MQQRRRCLWLLLGLLSSLVQAVPSKYVKQQAVKAADALVTGAEPLVTRYEKLKAEGKLDNPSDVGGTLGDVVAGQLGRLYTDAWELYAQALGEGWTADDPDIAAIRAKLEAARAKFETYGYWTVQRVDWPSIGGGYANRLEVLVRTAREAVRQIQAGQVDDGKGLAEDVDKRLKAILAELETAEDNGREVGLTRAHPAIAATQAECQRTLAGGTGAVAAVDDQRQAIDQDAAAIGALLKQCLPVFAQAERAANGGGTEEQLATLYTETLTALNAFDRDVRPGAQRLLDEFGTKYGTDGIAVHNKMAALRGTALDYQPDPGTAYDQVRKGLADLTETRQGLARKFLADVNQTRAGIDDYDEDIRVAIYDKLRVKLDWAVGYDPDLAEARQLLANLGAEQAAKAAEIERLIDGRTWPKNMTGFQGPGNVAELLRSASEWLKAHCEKDQEELLAVRLVGDWIVFERDALGRTAAYGLPVLAVYRRFDDKAAGRDVAVVFELSMVTTEAKMAPPFKLAGVGGSWRMRASKVPAE